MADVTKYHSLDGLNNRNSFSPSSGGQKSKIKVSARLAPCEAVRKDHSRSVSRFPFFKRSPVGTSLVVQWLRLRIPNAGGPGLIPGQGTRSHMLQLKDPAHSNEDPTCCN